MSKNEHTNVATIPVRTLTKNQLRLRYLYGPPLTAFVATFFAAALIVPGWLVVPVALIASELARYVARKRLDSTPWTLADKDLTREVNKFYAKLAKHRK